MDLGSAWRGIKAMRRHPGNKAKWVVRRSEHQGIWVCFWTPSYHEGAGPYVSLGLWWIAIYRGY